MNGISALMKHKRGSGKHLCHFHQVWTQQKDGFLGNRSLPYIKSPRDSILVFPVSRIVIKFLLFISYSVNGAVLAAQRDKDRNVNQLLQKK